MLRRRIEDRFENKEEAHGDRYHRGDVINTIQNMPLESRQEGVHVQGTKLKWAPWTRATWYVCSISPRKTLRCATAFSFPSQHTDVAKCNSSSFPRNTSVASCTVLDVRRMRGPAAQPRRNLGLASLLQVHKFSPVQRMRGFGKATWAAPRRQTFTKQRAIPDSGHTVTNVFCPMSPPQQHSSEHLTSACFRG